MGEKGTGRGKSFGGRREVGNARMRRKRKDRIRKEKGEESEH